MVTKVSKASERGNNILIPFKHMDLYVLKTVTASYNGDLESANKQQVNKSSEGRKEMFNLTTHSTHCIYGYMTSHIIIMVTDHSDCERGNPLPPHGLLFPISSKGSFICIIPHRITHTRAFVTPVVEHWLDKSSKTRDDFPALQPSHY